MKTFIVKKMTFSETEFNIKSISLCGLESKMNFNTCQRKEVFIKVTVGEINEAILQREVLT